MFKRLFALTTLFTTLTGVLAYVSAEVNAHEPSFIDMPSQLLVKSAMALQNKGVVEQDQAWLIPGVMQGGEAVPSASGAAINDLQLFGRLNLQDDYYLASKVGFHQHQGDGELALENYWLGKYFIFDNNIIKIDVGKMATDTTPTANHHASQDLFGTKPLLADVFFGGHHKDTGVKANWYWQQFEVGFEVFNGDNWPSSSTESRAGGFARFHGFIGGIKTDVATWYTNGDAKNRTDNRYNSGHSHSLNIVTTPTTSFTGQVEMLGSYLTLSQQVTPNILWQAQWEWIQSKHKGEITDNSQTGRLAQTLDGYRLMLGLEVKTHKLYLQHELLAVNNRFTNTTVTFLEQQGLYNDNFEPTRLMVGYHWQWRPNFTFRLESVREQTLLEQTQQYWTIGLIWHHKLI